MLICILIFLIILSLQCYTIDARNHGTSPWSDSMTLVECSDDILQFTADHGLEKINIVGHRFVNSFYLLFSIVCTVKNDLCSRNRWDIIIIINFLNHVTDFKVDNSASFNCQSYDY